MNRKADKGIFEEEGTLQNLHQDDNHLPVLPPAKKPPPLVDRLRTEVAEPTQVPGSQIFYYDAQSKFIGKGGSSLVFRGYYGTPEKKAAVKIVKCDVGIDPDINELLVWKSITSNEQPCSSGIVSIYNCVLDANDTLYICMELASCNLEEDLKYNFNTHPDYPRISAYMKSLAAGLEYLHNHNIIHRDIKPQNIFIFHNGRQRIAKLGDLGLSRELSNSEGSLSFGKGTRMWMSPEALRALDDEEEFINTKAMDIFSFGLVIVYSLCFQKHVCDIKGKVLVNIKNNLEVKPLLEMMRFPCMEHLTVWMLKKEPSRRPTISQCRSHPFLWENEEEKTLEFFKDILRGTEVPDEDDANFKDYLIVHATIRSSIAAHYYKANGRLLFLKNIGFSWKWTEEIDPVLLKSRSGGVQGNTNLQKRHNYNEYSPLSLLKLIMDRVQNPENMVDGVISRLFSEDGSDETFSRTKFARYFMDKCPELVWMLFCILAKISPEFQILNELKNKYLKEFMDSSDNWNCGERMDKLMTSTLRKLVFYKKLYLNN